MPVQLLALAFFIALGLISLGTFIYFFASTKSVRPGQDYYKKVSSLRLPFFLFLSIFIVFFLFLTLPYVPYPKKGISPDMVVMVEAVKFSFLMWEAGAEDGGAPIQIPAGSLVEFRVTSKDVNHGFAIYSPEGTLLGQVQAMPGYVNRLLLRFDKPGIYKVLCLEYCGLAHHLMQTSFEVVPQKISKKEE